MKIRFLTRMYVLALVAIICVAGCRQPDPLADIEGIRSLKVEHDPSTSFQELAWSPDGRSLAARIYEGRNNSSVALIDLQTGMTRTLYEAGGPYYLLPEWSPDGQSLIFAAPSETVPHLGAVVVADAQSGHITRNLGFGGFATWTADLETVIVLEFDSSCREEIAIYEYNLTTGEKRPIGSTGSCYSEAGDRLDASNDGKLVVPSSDGMKNQILNIADSTEVGTITPMSRDTVWSPNGTMLAFLADGVNSDEEDDGIVLTSADGQCSSEPLKLGAELLSVDWSPDGNQLVFSTREANRLYFLDLTTGAGKQLMDSYRAKCAE